ncbi:MAG: trimethylamine methyltransferase family protein [Anaerolineales bacterium]|nr:trimethylamine methyltransferase family protein [Anaerolineales bacterium]
MDNFQLLTGDEIVEIHQATLQLLSELGVQMTQPAAVEMLCDHGACQKGDRLLIPPDLVERCVAQCPPMVNLCGRDVEKAVTLGDGKVSLHNVGGVPNVYDPDTSSRRPAIRKDNKEAALLLDALPNVTALATMYTPADVEADLLPLWMYFDTVANSTKPIHLPGTQTAGMVRLLTEMVQIACPGTDLSQHQVPISPISPLIFPDDLVEAILEVARYGCAFAPLPCPIVGATAPMSFAGAIVQQNAELLAAIVLAQAAKPGLPLIYHGRLSVMDPRSGLSIWGGPDVGIMSAATVQMGHYYNLPVDVYGFCTSAQPINIQNGYERTINALIPVIAGADEISGVGEMDGGVMSSLAQMVIDDEIMSSLRHIRRGIGVNRDSLALEVIKAVTMDSGNFLAEMHTVRYLRGGELHRARLALRDGWNAWQAAGSPDIVRKATDRARQLLSENRVPPLSHEQETAMLAVIGAAAKN